MQKKKKWNLSRKNIKNLWTSRVSLTDLDLDLSCLDRLCLLSSLSLRSLWSSSSSGGGIGGRCGRSSMSCGGKICWAWSGGITWPYPGGIGWAIWWWRGSCCICIWGGMPPIWSKQHQRKLYWRFLKCYNILIYMNLELNEAHTCPICWSNSACCCCSIFCLFSSSFFWIVWESCWICCIMCVSFNMLGCDCLKI